MSLLGVRQSRLVTALLVSVCTCKFLHAGILVTSNGKDFQFQEALTISVNGKDKALEAGPTPRFTGPVNKLPAVKMEGEIVVDRAASALALIGDGTVTYLLPTGLPKNGPSSMKEAWTATNISYKKSKSDKSPESVAFASFVAYLPEGPSQLVTLCSNRDLLKLISGGEPVVDIQLRLMRAAVATYSSDPAFQSLQKYVGETMQARYQQFETGTAGVDALEEALRFVELSKTVYPAVADQTAVRQQIQSTKAWLDRRIAILHAFAAGSEWDRYILGDRDLEKYEGAFPELGRLRTKALTSSLESHRSFGRGVASSAGIRGCIPRIPSCVASKAFGQTASAACSDELDRLFERCGTGKPEKSETT